MTCKICVQARNSNTFIQGNSNFRTSTLSRHAANSDHQAALVGKSMESSFTKAIESSLKAKEKGVEVALKRIYWLAKEVISTHKYSRLLSFLEILACPIFKNCTAVLMPHIVLMLLLTSCKIQLLRL